MISSLGRYDACHDSEARESAKTGLKCAIDVGDLFAPLQPDSQLEE